MFYLHVTIILSCQSKNIRRSWISYGPMAIMLRNRRAARTMPLLNKLGFVSSANSLNKFLKINARFFYERVSKKKHVGKNRLMLFYDNYQSIGERKHQRLYGIREVSGSPSVLMASFTAPLAPVDDFAGPILSPIGRLLALVRLGSLGNSCRSLCRWVSGE